MNLVRTDLSKRPYPAGYLLGKRWCDFLRIAMRRARGLWSARAVAALAIDLGFDCGKEVVTPARAEWFRKVRRDFVERHPELAPINESLCARRNSVAEVDGVRFSAKIEQVFSYYEDLKTGIGDLGDIKVIVEIGSGYGRMARLMKLLDPARRYILVDLPESLVFAHAFLRVNFPEARIAIFTGGELDPHADLIFCPVQHLAELRVARVDLVINTYSFGEMMQGCVDHLVDCVERFLKPRYLYSLNTIFTDKSLHFDTGGLYGEANEAVLPLRPEWWPTRFALIGDLQDSKPRITGSVVLRHVATPKDALIRQLVEHGAVGHLYLAALWSRDGEIAAAFFAQLRREYASLGLPLEHFDRIGEVAVLNRQLGVQAATA